jgi:hypothetical protein
MNVLADYLRRSHRRGTLGYRWHTADEITGFEPRPGKTQLDEKMPPLTTSPRSLSNRPGPDKAAPERHVVQIGKAVPDSLNRTYSPGHLASLSKLSHGTVEELVHFGLLNPRGGLFGFRDLGLPEADLSNLRLHPAAHHAIEIEQPSGRTDKRGQFVLPVSPPVQNADALFAQAQAAEDAGEIAGAERLYRVLMKCDPADAAPPFNLGNLLRANGRKVEAEAAYRSATRADPTFAEAWYNLSDLLDQQGRAEAAIDCLCRALQAAPDYADAMFNLALLLQRASQHKEAAECWRRYLANDIQS